MLSTQLYSLTVIQSRAILTHGFRALRAGLWPQRSGDPPACLHTGYPRTLQQQSLSLFFSIHLPPIVPVVPQRKPFYPLFVQPLASYFPSNTGVPPPVRRLPSSSPQKSLEYRRVSTRPEGLMPFTNHESSITVHGLPPDPPVPRGASRAHLYFSRRAVRDSQAALRSLHP
jgi:hypothetical protein